MENAGRVGDKPTAFENQQVKTATRSGRGYARRAFNFGQHLNQSYLRLAGASSQHRLQRAQSPAVNRGVSPHFHIPPESVRSSHQKSNNSQFSTLSRPWRGSSAQLEDADATTRYHSLPRLKSSSSSTCVNGKERATPSRDASRSRIGGIHALASTWAWDEPASATKEARYISSHPLACKSASFGGHEEVVPPVEKPDWPAPPDLSVLLSEKSMRSVPTEPVPEASSVPTPIIRSSATIALTEVDRGIGHATRPMKSTHFADIGNEEQLVDDEFLDCVTSWSHEDDENASMIGGFTVASTSCYEDARSVLTERSCDLSAVSPMAKAIRLEQQREAEWLSSSTASLTAHLVSASRSANANEEPRQKTRYQWHDAASPSRDTHTHTNGHPTLHQMEYANVGNRTLSLPFCKASSPSPHPINSMATVLQSYDEIRPHYLTDTEEVSSNTQYPDHHGFLTGSLPRRHLTQQEKDGTTGWAATLPGVLDGDHWLAASPPSLYNQTYATSTGSSWAAPPDESGARGRHYSGAPSSSVYWGGSDWMRESGAGDSYLPVDPGHQQSAVWRERAHLVNKKIPYDELRMVSDGQHSLHKEVDRNHLEMYLSEEDFHLVFRMTRDAFYILPLWKQNDLKCRVNLF